MTEHKYAVIVNDLPIKITKDVLVELFGEYNIIEDSINIKEKEKANSAFAFVTFKTPEDMKRAIIEVNYTKLDGRPIRIVEASPDIKLLQRRNEGNLVITGLHEEIEVSQLHEAFANFGEIISCKIPTDPPNPEIPGDKGKSREYGFILFRNKEDAEKAMNDLKDASINGKEIKISKYVKPDPDRYEKTFTNVFIKVLPEDRFQTDEDVKKFFQNYDSEIQSATLMKDKDGKSLKTGFCNFFNHEDAVRAINEHNGTDAFGTGEKLVVVRAMSKRERESALEKQNDTFKRMKRVETRGRNLYIKNFGKEVTDEEFSEFFKGFGEVESACISRDPENNNESKGYGYVLFKDKEGANKAIEAGTTEKLGSTTPYVALHIPKKVREARQKYIERKGKEPNPDELDPKERLHYHLTWEYGVTGSKLKALLTSISDDQSRHIVESEETIEAWCNLPCNAQYLS